MRNKRWEDYETITCLDGEVLDVPKILDDQATARAACVNIAPYMGGLLGRLTPVYTFHIDTFATDGTRLFINLQFANKLDLTEKVFVLLHELMHCLLNHMSRGAGDDPTRSNIAADYECNITIADLGLIKINTMKGIGAYVDKKYSSWGYEKIYADSSMSMSQPPQKKEPNKSSGDSGQGQQGNKPNPDDDSNGQVQPQDTTPMGSRSSTDSLPSGSVLSQSDGSNLAKVEGSDDTGAESVEKVWKDLANEVSKKIGNAPGGSMFKNKLDLLYKTSTDWKRILRNVIGRSLSPEKKDNRFTNKNTLVSQGRFARTEKDLYNSMDTLIAWVDTSGSMSSEDLRKVLGEVYSIALLKKPMRITIVQFDSIVQDVKTYNSLAEFKDAARNLEMHGGGGTSVRDCFRWLKTLRGLPAELVVVFTDGYLDQVKRPPRDIRSLVWVVVDNPSFDLEYPDRTTKVVRVMSRDIH